VPPDARAPSPHSGQERPPSAPSAAPGIADAVERFFDDAKARGLSEATIGKQNVLLRKQFLPWCPSRGFHALKQLGVGELTQFRTTWKDSPISKYKKQERLKGSSTLRRTRLDSDEPGRSDQAGQGAAVADAPVRRESDDHDS
jgi:hypothetical protein